jgi:hypothetical protein
MVPEYTRLLFFLASAFLSLSLFLCHIPLVVAMDGWLINFEFPHLLAPCFRLQVCFYRSRYSFLMKIDDGDLSINLFVSGSPHRSTEKLNARRKTSLENAKIAKQFQIPIAINIKNNRIGNGNTG